MASAVKKTTFEDYYATFVAVLSNIDEAFTILKNRQKNLSVWKDHSNYQEFLKSVERDALKKASQDLNLSDSAIRDRWRVLTLPAPVYCAIESDEITFSKAKLMTAIHFDFENEADIKVAEEIVEQIKSGLKNPEIKDIVTNRSSDVWNHSTVVMARLAEQHGINQDSKC